LHDIFAADTQYLLAAAPPQAAYSPPPLPIRQAPPPTSADPKPESAFVQVLDNEEVAKDNAPPTNATKGVQNTWDSLIDAAERFLERHETPKQEPKNEPKNERNETTELPPLTDKTTGTVETITSKPIVPVKNYVSDAQEEDAIPDLIIPTKTQQIEANTEKIDKKTGTALIFDIKSGSDMGTDKPIKDFRMAFGINERIFNINELFGGSASVYDAVLNELNAMSTFEAAAAYLQEKVIHEYGWEKPEKVKKAQWFVRLLWRRFLVA
jgi:hypothetical protein